MCGRTVFSARRERHFMKTIVVLSDTHGNRRAIDGLNAIFGECDYIIHLGDTSSDGGYIRKQYPDKTYVVNGNCDPMKTGENEIVLKVEDAVIYATHGHLFGAKSTRAKLAGRAAEKGAGVALYGHTHRALEEEIGGVTLFNPGCMTRYSRNSYLYLVINGDKATGKIVFLN